MGCGNSRTKHDDTVIKKQNKNIVESSGNNNVEQKPTTDVTTKTQGEIINIEKKDNEINPEVKNAKPKIKHGFTITVKNSEPQKLDPNSVFYVENTNPVKNDTKVDADNTKKPKITKMGTFDKELEEKIKKRVDFDELVGDLMSK